MLVMAIWEAKRQRTSIFKLPSDLFPQLSQLSIAL